MEEVIAYNIFDQNQDGLVSQDEINVSQIKILISFKKWNLTKYIYSPVNYIYIVFYGG